MTNTCVVCGIEFESSKSAKTCSPRCRVTLSRSDVTHGSNVTLKDPDVTLAVTFRFTIAQRPGSKPGDDNWNENKAKVREAKYWYDVPLAAIPVREKDWPEMPDYMDGRQYFLWWKNEFDTKDSLPVVYNPFPPQDNVHYEMGGEGSRKWGAS